jgi:hypothetical protein
MGVTQIIFKYHEFVLKTDETIGYHWCFHIQVIIVIQVIKPLPSGND